MSYPTARSVAFHFTIGATEFNDQVIREFGLLRVDGVAVTLFARRGGFNVPKTSVDQVQGTWTITF